MKKQFGVYTFINKQILSILMCLLSFLINIRAQNNKSVSMFDVSIPGVIIVGSYTQLIELQGKPNSSFFQRLILSILDVLKNAVLYHRLINCSANI